MSRWIGHDHIDAVLAASDAWRERCFVANGSLFSDETLWTLGNIQDLKQRYTGNPISGTEQSFIDKLKAQLDGASNEVIRLTAEVVWFLLLTPVSSVTKPEKKRSQIKEIWEWSGADFPESPHMSDQALMGVAHPGPAYLTRRHDQFHFFLDVLGLFKSLPEIRQTELMTQDTPWQFMSWLDTIEYADRRPMRNAILYFLFPDDLERNLSNGHRLQIVKALKHRLPNELQPQGPKPSLCDLDRAIYYLRKDFENELGTKELDFYRPPIYTQWFRGIREKACHEISAALKKVLSDYDLELRQCGSKKKSLEKCKPVNEKTGFWKNPADATNKPLRWFVHLDLSHNKVVASVPDEHGSRRIAFANTAQGTSGALTTRIIPAIKVSNEKFVIYESWEWMLLHCFLPALPAGSSGQLFEEFDENSGRLIYMGQEQPYIASALITLNEEEDVFLASELPRPLKYIEATKAIAEMIHISPTVIKTSETKT